ncbi:MAG: aldehyde dehydrogenase family protein [Desulfovibrio sp.]|jgi:acyl-CoA reductase-like NAD-dependent aldehyde dehydrogenase|nr:aldehyde dehydrogenase family protein [Desulfovibrio sp.]
MEKPQLLEKYQLFIDGRWQDAADGGTFETICPATGERLALCAEAAKEDVDAAVAAARAAWEGWKETSPALRSGLLLKIADIIEANAAHLALVESFDNGKPIRETMAVDVPASADHFRYFAGAVRGEEGRAVMLDGNTLSITLREPIGVVGQIVPWNFPLLIAAWKLAPALASGCCSVFKPSSFTSLSVLELTRLIGEVLPKGVLNVITGKGSRSGRFMLEHRGIRKLAFTGSTEVGYQVAAAAADKLIPATLELGGKSANIFFPDCDWEMAMDGLQLGIVFNQGQVCSAGSRVFVHEAIYDRFVQDACAAFDKIRVGMPWEGETQMGAQIGEDHLLGILKRIEAGKAEGAKVACGGARLTDGAFARGAFMRPTLLVDAHNGMRVAREEIFGPVAVVIKFSGEEEVIRMVNDSPYGLGGGVWTRDVNRAIRVSRAVETGRMWVNCYNFVPAGAPFGGYKESGIGRETHKMILEHYSQTKSIMINLAEGPSGFYPR